ncbi:MAG: putative ABC transport system permease protein [Planctomycetota bacterium]|jgi:putative ABC transport system permease protein
MIAYFRGLWMLVSRSLRSHLLSTSITIMSTALATGLVMAVFAVSLQSRNAFAGGPLGFDAVLGARGSQLQLVLNVVFHLETSPGNIPWQMYTDLQADKRVELAIPYALGDNYRGYRIVGTSEELFTKFEYEKGKLFEFEPGSRAFDARRREAVIGARVARETGLKVGSHFNPSHGLERNLVEEHTHEEEFVVCGVLKNSNTPNDRVIWIPVEGVYRMSGHKLRGSGEEYVPQDGATIDDEHKELSAVLLKLKGRGTGFQLANQYNRSGKQATLAWPIGASMAELLDKMGWVNRILEFVAYLVMMVASGSILASLYNTMNERSREFAILRSLGARKSTVFGVILLEAQAIALLGSVVGYGVFAAILLGASAIVRDQTGVTLDVWVWHDAFVWTPLGMLFAGGIAGILPALKAYSTDVAMTLSRDK